MDEDRYPAYLAGEPYGPNADLEVFDKYTGQVAARCALADAGAIERAIAAAAGAAGPMRRMKAYQRRAVLEHCIRRFRQRSDELARWLCIEAGKPIRDARGEVARLVDTFSIAADEAVRPGGQVLTMDISARGGGHRGMYKRVPVGPCALISPFNFPLNLAAHKVAPAIAAGCPFILKPASATPIGALLIGQALAETDLPPGAFSILPARHEDARPLVSDDRLKLLSFTGSPEVGWGLKAKAGMKKVVLELGGNAACIIDAGTDIEDCIERVIFGAFYQSGQSCISVQRLLVHTSLYEPFRERLVEKARSLRSGDPKLEETFIGPIISDAEADRIERWIHEAVDAGAKLLCGGGREGRIIEAAVLEDVPPDADAACREMFGPVVNIERFDDFDEALGRANDSRYGIQAGVFTRDIDKAMRAWDELEVGGVLINEVPAWRIDHMPYGGVKESGIGREGVPWAIEHLTEPKLLVIRDRE